MAIKRTPEFRAESVRLALTGGLPRQQVADDLTIGLSTLGKWVANHNHAELMAGPNLKWAGDISYLGTAEG